MEKKGPFQAKADYLRRLREAYQRDLDAGLIRGKQRRRKGKSHHRKRPRKIHQRPEPGLWRWLRLRVWERDGWTCQYCGSQDRQALQVDHIMPISKGGDNTLKNLVTACRPCNTKKSARLLSKEKRKMFVRGLMVRFYARTEMVRRQKAEAEELERMFRDKMQADDD